MASPAPLPDDELAAFSAEMTAEKRQQRRVEGMVRRSLLRERLLQVNQEVAALGVKPLLRVDETTGAVGVARCLPREVREYARDLLVAAGIPVLASTMLSPDAKVAEQLAAVELLRKTAMPSRWTEDDEGGEDRPLQGVILMPPDDPPPEPPVEPAPQAPVVRVGQPVAVQSPHPPPSQSPRRESPANPATPRASAAAELRRRLQDPNRPR